MFAQRSSSVIHMAAVNSLTRSRAEELREHPGVMTEKGRAPWWTAWPQPARGPAPAS